MPLVWPRLAIAERQQQWWQQRVAGTRGAPKQLPSSLPPSLPWLQPEIDWTLELRWLLLAAAEAAVDAAAANNRLLQRLSWGAVRTAGHPLAGASASQVSSEWGRMVKAAAAPGAAEEALGKGGPEGLQLHKRIVALTPRLPKPKPRDSTRKAAAAAAAAEWGA